MCSLLSKTMPTSQREDQGMTTIHLSGLPSFWSDMILSETFAQFGTVLSATIVTDLFGHSLGFGLVQLAEGDGPDENTIDGSAKGSK